MEDYSDHIARCRSLERHAATHHFVNDTSQAPDVCPSINLLSSGLLRRHIKRRAHDYPGVCLDHDTRWRIVRLLLSGVLIGQLCQPKVEHLNVTVPAQHDVLWLYVSVYDAGLVSRGERRGHLDANLK